MKKLLAMAAILGLALTASADLMLYWTIELDSDGKVTGNAGDAVKNFYTKTMGEDFTYPSVVYAQILAAKSTDGSSVPTDGYTALDGVIAGSSSDTNITGYTGDFDAYIVRLYNANEEIAFSDPIAYSSLIANGTGYIYDELSMKAGTAMALNGLNFTATPEPTGGLLTLLGLAALALRRRRA